MSDERQRQEDINLRAAERAHDHVNDLGKRLTEASIRDAQEAIKIALLINGGAAVAMLAFISGIVGRTGITILNLKSVSNSLFWFAGGVVLAGITAAFAYLSNGLYAGNLAELTKIWQPPYVIQTPTSLRKFWWARFFNWAGFILAWMSLLGFIIGVFVAARALSNIK